MSADVNHMGLLKNPNWSACLGGFSQSISGDIGAFGFQKIVKAPRSGLTPDWGSSGQTLALQKHLRVHSYEFSTVASA